MDNTDSESPHSAFDDSSPRSSATSLSSIELSEGPPLQPGRNPVAKILGDRTNFVALGCLCFEDFFKAEHGEGENDWKDVIAFPAMPFEPVISNALGKLIRAGWVQAQQARSALNPRWIVFRIYLLYTDVGQGLIDRGNQQLRSAVDALLREVDISPATWNGQYTPGKRRDFDPWATAEEDRSSLFYLFNKLRSPSPSATNIEERYSREALEDLLDSSSGVPGLRTPLYPYQRRSAGAMLEREVVTRIRLDPRLEERSAPDGGIYYYNPNPKEMEFRREPRYFEACRGGVLAESMGLGKTLICLALILATKDHLPKMPVQYATLAVRPEVASLADMAVAAVNRKSVPWKVEFERVRQAWNNEMTSCTKRLSRTPPMYEIPGERVRWNRKTTVPKAQQRTLTSTTLIVVPQNLIQQWQSEITKHVEGEALKVLVMNDRRKPLPLPDVLREYDVILFTRSRFDLESKDGEDQDGRRIGKAPPPACRCPYIGATRNRACRCLKEEMLYESPLKHLHFKRIIVDEGHFFSNSNSNTANVATKLVTADHRWSVSGTPARDLLGVEVEALSDVANGREDILQHRRTFGPEDKSGAIEALGSLMKSFLKVEPWVSGGWKEYVFRHEDKHHTFSGFSTCLPRALEDLVLRTRPEDVERDIELPTLHHSIVRLEPSYYDKLTASLFALVLIANAVTSERTDADYLFHKNSQKARLQLISNLRQSAFFWTGFGEHDVLASIKNGKGYLAKENTGASQEDRQLLEESLKCTGDILNSAGWKALSRSHELGVFVEAFPEESAEHWAFSGAREPLLTGISQLLEAQGFVNQRLGHQDPGEGLSGAGIKAMAAMAAMAKSNEAETSGKDVKKKRDKTVPKGVPTSSLNGEPSLKHRTSNNSSPRKSANSESKPTRGTKRKRESKDQKSNPSNLLSLEAHLPTDSPYAKTRVVGTASAKISYLVAQILKHYKNEKILVFYSGDNIAYYIAQLLELFHIRHEIYAKSLAAPLKAEYVVRFDQEPQDRVLLMDVSQAAFGLNLSSASRIYFVNPVCRPDVEAQAIKRAHRIGQTREVHVETLVLKDTIEEKMLERSKRMSRAEHLDAKVLEDDGGIREIIQSARIMPLNEAEKQGKGQMAPLETAERLWARPGWNEATTTNRKETRRKHPIKFTDVTDMDDTERIVEDEFDFPPRTIFKRPRLDGPEDNKPQHGFSRLGASKSSSELMLPAMSDRDTLLPVLVTTSPAFPTHLRAPTEVPKFARAL